jgi:hypothetical protein
VKIKSHIKEFTALVEFTPYLRVLPDDCYNGGQFFAAFNNASTLSGHLAGYDAHAQRFRTPAISALHSFSRVSGGALRFDSKFPSNLTTHARKTELDR